MYCGLFDPDTRHSRVVKERWLALMAEACTASFDAMSIYHSRDSALCVAAVSNRERGCETVLSGCTDAKHLVLSQGSLFSNEANDVHELIMGTATEDIPRLVSRLDGSFSSVVYREGQALFLIADFFGSKPLYWIESEGIFAFSSSLRAFHSLPFFTPTIDMDTLAEYCSFRFIRPPRTIFTQAARVPLAHFVLHKGGRVSSHRYGAFTPGFSGEHKISVEKCMEQVEESLGNSISRYVGQEKEASLVLTGSVSSSLIGAIATQSLNLPLYSEVPTLYGQGETQALNTQRLANLLGTTHVERMVPGSPDSSNSPDSFGSPSSSGSLDTLLDFAGSCMEQPTASLSCLQLYSLVKAQPGMKRVLTDSGAKMLFGGNSVHRAVLAGYKSSSDSKSKSSIGEEYLKNIASFSMQDISDLFQGVPSVYRDRLYGFCDYIDRETWLSPIDRLRRADMASGLSSVALPDLFCASSGQEFLFVAPYMTAELARLAASLPMQHVVGEGVEGSLLERLARKYLPEDVLCYDEEAEGKAVKQWLSQQLPDATEKLLYDTSSILGSILPPQSLQRFVDTRKGALEPDKLLTLCVAECFLRNLRDSPSPSPYDTMGIMPRPPWEEQRALRVMLEVCSSLALPVLVFSEHSIESFDWQGVDGYIVTAVPGTENECGIELDWQKSTHWSSLRSHIKPGTVAFFRCGLLPEPAMRKRLLQVGIGKTLILELGKPYLLANAMPSWGERLKAMVHLALGKSKREKS